MEEISLAFQVLSVQTLHMDRSCFSGMAASLRSSSVGDHQWTVLRLSSVSSPSPQGVFFSLLVGYTAGKSRDRGSFHSSLSPPPFVVTLLGNNLGISCGTRLQLLGKPPPGPGKDFLSCSCHLQRTPAIKYVLHIHCTTSRLHFSLLQNTDLG